jgi:4-hydroxy-3-polyprenylbenzoate decarboxylase
MYNEEMKTYVAAITGASGALYGIRLVRELLNRDIHVCLCVSRHAFPIIATETGIVWEGTTPGATEKKIRKYYGTDAVQYFSENNLSAPVSSGSFLTEGMIIAPCSMKTLSAVANGYAQNLIARAADVTLKEGRRLILCPREMPFSTLHLENMLRLSRVGATIAPPVPAFYQKPGTIDDMVDFVVGKILDSAGIPHTLFQRWE